MNEYEKKAALNEISHLNGFLNIPKGEAFVKPFTRSWEEVDMAQRSLAVLEMAVKGILDKTLEEDLIARNKYMP